MVGWYKVTLLSCILSMQRGWDEVVPEIQLRGDSRTIIPWLHRYGIPKTKVITVLVLKVASLSPFQAITDLQLLILLSTGAILRASLLILNPINVFRMPTLKRINSLSKCCVYKASHFYYTNKYIQF
jgi:hypothetical protein